MLESRGAGLGLSGFRLLFPQPLPLPHAIGTSNSERGSPLHSRTRSNDAPPSPSPPKQAIRSMVVPTHARTRSGDARASVLPEADALADALAAALQPGLTLTDHMCTLRATLAQVRGGTGGAAHHTLGERCVRHFSTAIFC